MVSGLHQRESRGLEMKGGAAYTTKSRCRSPSRKESTKSSKEETTSEGVASL